MKGVFVFAELWGSLPSFQMDNVRMWASNIDATTTAGLSPEEYPLPNGETAENAVLAIMMAKEKGVPVDAGHLQVIEAAYRPVGPIGEVSGVAFSDESLGQAAAAVAATLAAAVAARDVSDGSTENDGAGGASHSVTSSKKKKKKSVGFNKYAGDGGPKDVGSKTSEEMDHVSAALLQAKVLVHPHLCTRSLMYCLSSLPLCYLTTESRRHLQDHVRRPSARICRLSLDWQNWPECDGGGQQPHPENILHEPVRLACYTCSDPCSLLMFPFSH